MANVPKQQKSRHQQTRVCFFCEMTYGRQERNHHSSLMFVLAQFMARRGDYVALVAVAAPGTRNPDLAAQKAMKDAYLQRDLITVEFLEASAELYPGLERRDKASLAAYHFLRDKAFDIAYFPLEGGLGHFSACAKRTGVFENRPALVVIANEPTPWVREVNGRFPSHKSELLVDFMEQHSAAHCDFLVASSTAVLDWMTLAGWKLPQRRKVLLPLVTRDWLLHGAGGSGRIPPAVTDIAFFGSADPKDGLELFCDSIDVLQQKIDAPFKVTHIGAFGKVLGEHSGAYLLRRARRWRCDVNFVLKQETGDVVRYLGERNCLVVFPFKSAMASLELMACLDSGLSVVTTDTGGVVELLSRETREAMSAPPIAKDLAAVLAKALSAPQPGQPSEPLGMREAHWEKFNDAVLAVDLTRSAKARKRPLVSIITAHYERPELLSRPYSPSSARITAISK